MPLLFCSCASFGQKKNITPLKEYNYGDAGHDKLNDLIEANDGGIWAIGESESVYGKDQLNAYLLKLDKEGQQVFNPLRITGKGDLRGKSICENEFGDFYVVGENTFKEENNEKHGIWLNKYDFQGNNLWRKELFKSNTPLFIENLILDKEKEVLTLAGIDGNSIWFAQYDKDGNVFLPKKNFSKFVHAGYPVKSLDFQKIGNTYFLFGVFDNLGSNTLGIIKLDKKGNIPNGEMVSFPDFKIESIANIIELNENRIALTGTIDNKRTQVFYFSIDKSLDKNTMSQKRPISLRKGIIRDEGKDIALIDDKIIIAGNAIPSMSANNERFMLLTIDPITDKTIKTAFFGDKYKNWAQKLLLKRDGSLWIGGVKDDARVFSSNYEFYIAQLNKSKEVNNLVSKINEEDLSIIEAQFSLKKQSLILKENTKEFIQLIVQNHSKEDLFDLSVKSECIECTEGLIPNPSYFLSSLPAGSSKLIAFPINTAKEIKNQENEIQFSLLVNNHYFKKIVVKVQTIQYEPIKLIGHSYRGDNGNKYAIKGKRGVLLIHLDKQELNVNNNNLEVILKLRRDDEVFFTKGNNFQLSPSLNGIDTIKVPLEISYTHDKEDFEVTLYIRDKKSNNVYNLTSSIIEPVKTPRNLEVSPELANALKLIEAPNSKEPISIKIPPHNSISLGKTPSLELLWSQKNSPQDTVQTHKELYEIVINWQGGNFKIKKENFTVIVKDKDGKIVNTITGKNIAKRKADKVMVVNTAKGTIPSMKVPVALHLGRNVITVTYEEEDISAVTELPHIVEFSPKKRGTLHLLSVGIPYNNSNNYGQLKYSTKDAEDFANLFNQQKGIFYDSINTIILNDSKNTSAITVMEQLKKMTEKEYLFSREDAIIVFFSGHGIMNERDAVIIDGDIGRGLDDISQRHIKLNEVYAMLDNEDIRCQKFVFVDACRNEGTSDKIKGRKGKIDSHADAFNNRLRASRDIIRRFNSCQDGDFSHESENWENGAFTRAIKDILNDKTLCKELDANEDRGLSISEIFNKVYEKIDIMLKNDKDLKNARQKPYYNLALDPENDAPFFVY